MSNNRYSIGILIAAVGLILLLGKLGIFGFFWGLLWPLIILAAGLLLHLLYFNRVLPSIMLVPGGILVTVSILFFLCTLFTWKLMGFLWPGFILAVAVGLYEYYMFDKHSPRGTFILAAIAAAVAAVCFSLTILNTVGVYVVALVLIAVGAFMALNKKRRLW